jgi:SAM-dependent methyltransferase
MRLRSVILALSRALFGTDLCLSDFPRLKSVRGFGISDSPVYAGGLADRFTYQNTFLHQPPSFDLVNPDETEFGRYDFVVCSEVLEHAGAPVERAFRTLAQLLKPAGVLILTTPFSIDEQTAEHFGRGNAVGITNVGGKLVVVSCRDDGRYEVFDNLIFHGGDGSTLEMRVFSESDLRKLLAGCGLTRMHFDGRGSDEFGVRYTGPCSLPIIAGREPFSLTLTGVAELVEQLTSANRALKESRWVQLGRRFGVGPRPDEPKSST